MAFSFFIDPEIQITYLKIYQECQLSDLAKLAVSPKNATRPRAKLMIFDFLDGDLEIDLEATHAFTRFIQGLEQTGFEREPSVVLTRNQSVALFFESLELMVASKTEYLRVFSALPEALAWAGMSAHLQAIQQIQARLLAQLSAEVDAAGAR